MKTIVRILPVSICIFFNLLAGSVSHGASLSGDRLKNANELRRFTASLLSGVNRNEIQIPEKIRRTFAKYPDIIFRMLQSARRREFLQTVEDSDIPVDFTPLQEKIFRILEEVFSRRDLPLIPSIRTDLLRICDLWSFLKKSDRIIILKKIPDESYLDLAKLIRKNISNYDYSQEEVLQEFKDSDSGLDTSGVPDAFIDLFHVMIDQYFNYYPVTEKIRILRSILRLPLPVSKSDKIVCFLNYSGPVVQKFFQLMGNKVRSPVYRKIVNRLKDEIQPFPFSEAKQILEKAYKKPLSETFSYIAPKPLAAATIAQVHAAKLLHSDEKIIIKIRRPGIKKQVKRELKILKSLVTNPGIFKILDSLEQVINEELDLRREASFLQEGRKYHDPSKGVYVVKMMEELPPREDVLAMEMAKGQSISKFTEESDAIQKSRGLKKLYEIWLKEALFGSGFFHADLHSGNIFYSPSESKPEYLLTLIDFGSVGQLNFSERKSLIQLGLGIFTQKPELIVAGFRPFEDMSCREAKKFYSTIKNIISERTDIYQQTNLIINEAVKRRFDISKNYLQFNRGKVFIEEHINSNNLLLEKAGLQKYMTSPTKVYVGVLLRKIPRLIKNMAFKKEDNKNSIIDRFTMKAAWKYVSSKYLNRKIKILPYDICKGRRKI